MSERLPTVAAARPPTHPWVFMVLMLPYGVMAGYLSVAVTYMLTQAHVSVGQTAGLVALSLVPHTWKFAWAPIADTTLSRKTWYLIACVATALGIFATGVCPATPAGLALLSVVVLVSNAAVTFLGMSVESLMAYDTPDDEKGRAGGWFQAGNLGGAGLGGGAGLWLAQHLAAPWMSAAILGAACLPCAAALWLVEEPLASHRTSSIGRSLVDVGRDLVSLARTRGGALTLLLCFLPLGAGAASELWSAVAPEWGASADAVAVSTGLLGGLVAAAGCVVGGWICDRTSRTVAYASFGVMQAICAVAMALMPRTQANYVFFTLLYALITGLTYAGFSALVLEVMGKGAAATKYNAFASLSNMPIYYMTRIDGWAHDRWGSAGMLLTESAMAMAALMIFLGVVAAVPRRAIEHESVAAAE